MDEKWKDEFTNALIHCQIKLRNENLICDTPPDEISSISTAIGEEIYKQLSYMVADREIITDEDLIVSNEINETKEYEECTEEPESTDDHVPEELDYVPLSYKEKTVALAKTHPKWSFETLRHKGCSRLKSTIMLQQWKEDVKKGGTKFDKSKQIESETFERFLEARNFMEQITTRTLQQWAMAAAFPLLSEEFSFSASNDWIVGFKRKYKIKQRNITRYVSSKEYATLEEIVKAAEKFTIQTKAIMPDFKLDHIININQNGCQCQMTYKTTRTKQGTKTELGQKENLNTSTHSFSYTAQYALTASGEVLPFVFLCMQEPTGKFSPLVQKNVDKLMNDFSNVIVTCSKSGKLRKELHKEFLIRVLSPYVNKNKFLLIIDSCEGQTDPTLYDDIFEDETGRASCTIKVIPSKCTLMCQPCDVYFYRQVKIFIKRLQNASALLKKKHEIATLEDAIKIHSLLLHQISAPIFIPMIQYAWYASKLIDDKPIFLNINEICFPLLILDKLCSCKKAAFIRCAWCESELCFTCFYNNYHPKACKSSYFNCEQSYESDD